MNVKSITFSLALISSLLFSITPALAVDGSASGKGVEKRCEASTKILNQRIEQYNKTKDAHLMKYTNLKEHFLALADRLDKKNLDTTKLRADGQILDTKIQKATSDYQAFIQKLEDAKKLPCDTSKGAFKTIMESSRTALKTFHSDVQDIRNFFKTVIKPDLQALRTEKKDIKEGTKSSNE